MKLKKLSKELYMYVSFLYCNKCLDKNWINTFQFSYRYNSS